MLIEESPGSKSRSPLSSPAVLVLRAYLDAGPLEHSCAENDRS